MHKCFKDSRTKGQLLGTSAARTKSQLLGGWYERSEFQLLESDQGVGTLGLWYQLLEPVESQLRWPRDHAKGQRSCDGAQFICECAWDDGLDVVWRLRQRPAVSASTSEGGDVAVGGCVLCESCAVEGSTLPVAVCLTHTISVLSVAQGYLLSFATG